MANSTRPLPTVQGAKVLTLHPPLHVAQQSQTKYQVLLTTAELARVSLCSVLTGVTVLASGNVREGDLRTRHFAEGRIALAAGCPECSLDLFLWDSPPFFGLQPKARDACPDCSFQSLGPLITSRSLTPAEPPVLSEASCPQTRGLYQPLPASSRMACLWPRHSDSPAFGQRGHPGGVPRLFRAGGLQRLGGSRRALGADCTEEGAPGALGAPSTPWTGRSGVASYRPCRQPPGVMRFSPAPSSS